MVAQLADFRLQLAVFLQTTIVCSLKPGFHITISAVRQAAGTSGTATRVNTSSVPQRLQFRVSICNLLDSLDLFGPHWRSFRKFEAGNGNHKHMIVASMTTLTHYMRYKLSYTIHKRFVIKKIFKFFLHVLCCVRHISKHKMKNVFFIGRFCPSYSSYEFFYLTILTHVT